MCEISFMFPCSTYNRIGRRKKKVGAKFPSETPGELHGALTVTKGAELGEGVREGPSLSI